MNYKKPLTRLNFLYWIIRVILFSLVWIGFIWITAIYGDYKYPGDDGPLYYFNAGLLTTLPMLVGYNFIDYKFRKRKFDEKSLWKLWLLAISFALITSPVWVTIIMLLWLTRAYFFLLPLIVLIGSFVALIKFKN